MQTEFEFTLPRGYVDANGQTHQVGRMRLAMAIDEIEPVRDPRVQANESYLPVLLLSRVVTALGTLPAVTPEVIEGLFAVDLAYLQELYLRLNSPDNVIMTTVCPQCSHRFNVQVAPLGV